MEKGFISIRINKDTELIAEKNIDNGFAEMMVFLKKANGSIQDLARVGQDIEYSEETQDLEIIPGEYYVKVYADELQEDYTHDFIVKEYKEEDE